MARKPTPRPPTRDLFLSWSGPRSKHVALAFRGWIKAVIQSARPWMSDVDIEKGAVGLAAIAQELKGCRAGVVFLTPENQTAQWINYEGGAIANAVGGDRARVFTVLLGGMRPGEVTGPLSQFQHTQTTKPELKRLATDIAKALGSELEPDDLTRSFEAHWPEMENALNELPAEPAPIKKRTPDEMAEETLMIARAILRGLPLPMTSLLDFRPGSVTVELQDAMVRLKVAEEMAARKAAAEGYFDPPETSLDEGDEDDEPSSEKR
jgi:hypothetical protein